MKTADYKNAAYKIQLAMTDFHNSRAEAWVKIGNVKKQAEAIRDSTHCLARAIIINNPNNRDKAYELASYGNFVYDLLNAENPTQILAHILKFFETYRFKKVLYDEPSRRS